MGHVILITGGTRSGKSAYGEQYATSTHADKYIYIATADKNNNDKEMRQRIALHRQRRRGYGWTTIEAPIELPQSIRTYDHTNHVILVDCLTLWLSNLLLRNHDIEKARSSLIETLREVKGKIILITNEVGSGIVPEYALGRIFRDESGQLNCAIAAFADEVYFVVAGIPTILKFDGKISHPSPPDHIKKDIK